MLRLFVGIGFPPTLKLQLSLLRSGVPGAKWVDPGNFHLTLRFIGETDEVVAADIDDALRRLRARRFTLQLAGTGVSARTSPAASGWVSNARLSSWHCVTRSSRRWFAWGFRRRPASSRRTSLWRGCTSPRSTS